MHNRRSQSRRFSSPLPLSTLLVIALGVVAVLTSGWAVVLQNRVESLEQHVNQLEDANATLRANANATMYTLERTDIAPPQLAGQVYLNPTGSGVVVVSNLPLPGDNEAYHVWFESEDGASVTRGGALYVSSTGQGFALIPADTMGYARIGISLDSEDANSDTPGAFLLVAEVPTGRG